MTEPHVQRIYDGLDAPCSPLSAVQECLRPGETLIWAGRPASMSFTRANVLFLLAALGMVVCSTAMVAFAGFRLLVDAVGDPTLTWVQFGNGGLLFLLGSGMVYAALTMPLNSVCTAYAITDQRTMIVSTFLRRRVRSFAPEDLDEPLRLDRDAGYGHLIFAKRKKHLLLQDKERTRYVGIGFFRVRDVAEVETALLKLRASAAAAVELDDPVLKPA